MRATIVYLFTLVLFLSSQNLSGQTKFVNEFLNIGVGARAHGMFGSVVADVNDVTAAFWNPAGLSQMDAPFAVSAMHAEWFGSVANYDYMGIAKRLDKDANSFGGLSVIRMGIDNIPNTLSLIGPDGSTNYDNVTSFSAVDYAIILSYSRRLIKAPQTSENGELLSPTVQMSPIGSGLSIGGNAKIIRRSIGSFGGAWGFGFDLGLMWSSDKFSFGFMAKDITTTFNAWSFNLTEEEQTVFTQTNNDIPISSTEIALPKFILGGAFKGGSKKLSYNLQANATLTTDGTQSGILSGDKFAVYPTIGLELGIIKKVFIRAGIGNIQSTLNATNAATSSLEFQPNIGLGLNLGRINIDYALTNIGEVAGALSSHIVSLNLRFNQRGEAPATQEF